MVLSSADFFLKISFLLLLLLFFSKKKKISYISRLSSSLDPDHGRRV